MNPTPQKSGAAPASRKQTAAHPPHFDTMKAVRSLKNAEFGDKQAVTLVETIQETQSELATRTDLEKTELALRGDMEKMEAGIRRDMEKMEASLRGEIKEMGLTLRNEMKDQFATLYWRLLLGASTMTAIFSTVVILAK